MPDEKAPSSGAFLPTSLMYFCSGEPMHFAPALTALCIDDLEMHDGTSLGRFQTLSFGFHVNATSAEEFGSTSV